MKVVRHPSYPTGVIINTTHHTIRAEIDSLDDYTSCISDSPGLSYYEMIPHNRAQKPYFIWTCHYNATYNVIKDLLESIGNVMLNWTGEKLSLNDVHLYMIPSQTDGMYTYHVIIDNWFHQNGEDAQSFFDEVTSCFDSHPTHSCLISPNKRGTDKWILHKADGLHELRYHNVTVSSTIIHTHHDIFASLITYVRGRMLKPKPKPITTWDFCKSYWTNSVNYIGSYFKSTSNLQTTSSHPG